MEREDLNSSPQETICRPVRFGLQTKDGGGNDLLETRNPSERESCFEANLSIVIKGIPSLNEKSCARRIQRFSIVVSTFAAGFDD